MTAKKHKKSAGGLWTCSQCGRTVKNPIDMVLELPDGAERSPRPLNGDGWISVYVHRTGDDIGQGLQLRPKQWDMLRYCPDCGPGIVGRLPMAHGV